MKNATISPSIVIDTNVFLSAIVFGGQPRKLINLIADDALTLVTAEELVTELRRVITSKFPEFIADLKKIEKLLESDATWVRLGGVTIAVSRDSDYDKFIEVAVLGNCHYIISGDKDLLDIKLYDSVKIVSVSEFLEDFNSR